MRPDVLAIIPARGGSKGIPRKNLGLLCGRPLLSYSVEAALNAEAVTRVVVSTDDDEIAEVAGGLGADVVMRPAEISGDEATSESALMHTLDQLQEQEGFEPELVVFLQATSPIRSNGDVDRAIETLKREGADSLLSVVASHSFLWRLNEGIPEPLNYDPKSRPRRQDLAPEYAENGSIYVFKPWVLRQHNCRLGGRVAIYEMSRRSGVDIDTTEDLELCEWIMSRQRQGGGRDAELSKGSQP